MLIPGRSGVCYHFESYFKYFYPNILHLVIVFLSTCGIRNTVTLKRWNMQPLRSQKVCFFSPHNLLTNLCCLLKCVWNSEVLPIFYRQQEAAAEPHDGRSHGLWQVLCSSSAWNDNGNTRLPGSARLPEGGHPGRLCLGGNNCRNTQQSLKKGHWCRDHNFFWLYFFLLQCQLTHWLVQVSQLKPRTTAWRLGFWGGPVTLNFTDFRCFRVTGLLQAQAYKWGSSESRQEIRF